MGTLQAEADDKTELDDSGCVQDESPPAKKPAVETEYCGSAELLDLSDDVLLCILKYCSPRDLKALGYSCPRLGSLVLDRALWTRVDARGEPCGRTRLRWMLTRALHAGTTQLLLTGHAQDAKGCLGHVNRTREEDEGVKDSRPAAPPRNDNAGSTSDSCSDGSPELRPPEVAYPLFRQHARLNINALPLPRLRSSPRWPEDQMADPAAEGCAGPQFTLTRTALRRLRAMCPRLTRLSLQHCNINCDTTGINQFPTTLKELSLCGVKCYNMPMDKSFLFKIHDYLPNLERLDVSECDWMEPASLLPLSKMETLTHLYMRDCYRMSEFVAYASLATRYGFKKLKVLDLRGSPVGDSEVSALGWVPELEELYLAPARPAPPPRDHAHYRGEPLPPPRELDAWELEEPEYYRDLTASPEPKTSPESSVEDIEDQINMLRQFDRQLCTCASVVDPPSGGEGSESGSTSMNVEAERDGNRPKRKPEDNSSGDNSESQAGPSAKRQKSRNTHDSSKGKQKVARMPSMSSNIRRFVKDTMNRSGHQNTVEITLRQGEVTINQRNSDSESSESSVDTGSKSVNSASSGDTWSKSANGGSIGDTGSKSECSGSSVVNGSKSVGGGSSVHTGSKRSSESTSENGSMSGVTKSNSMKSASENESTASKSVKKFKRYSNSDCTCTCTCTPRGTDGTESENTGAKENKFKTNEVSGCQMNEGGSENSGANENKLKTNESNEASGSGLGMNEDAGEISGANENKLKTNESNEASGSGVGMNEDASEKSGANENKLKTNESNEASGSGVGMNEDAGENSGANEKKFKTNDSMEASGSGVGMNDGASTSKCSTRSQNSSDAEEPSSMRAEGGSSYKSSSESKKTESDTSDEEEKDSLILHKTERYVRVRRNRNHVVMNVPANPPLVETRQQILYVNVGQQFHAVYRLMPNRLRNDIPHLRNMFYYPQTAHMDGTALVTDAAVRRFGRADDEDINYIHIGPNGLVPVGGRGPGSRPNRSNLRVLSVTGYRLISDRSLSHLATAAPRLQRIDFSRTAVTQRGVDSFRAQRPDCEVTFSEFVDIDNEQC